MSIRGLGIALVACLVACLGASVRLSSSPRADQSSGAAAQQPPRPTFRTDVEAVQLDLRVLDRDGRFIDDLTRDDFRVFEDGTEQTLTNFALINIPIERSVPALDGPRVEPDVVSNTHEDGRLYVIVLDDLEGQANPMRSTTVRAVAREFIERHMTDGDRAALVTTSGRRDMAQDFTSNRQRLLAAAARYEGGYGATAFARTSLAASGATGGDLVADNLRSTMLSLTSLADWLSKIDGRRKGIVMISERLGRSMAGGIDLTLAMNEASDIRDFIEAAARGNVSLYVIDPVGIPGTRGRGIRPVPTDVDDLSSFDSDRIQSLVTLAEATGGFAAVRSSDFSNQLKRIVVENSAYYLLGYVSSNQSKDGKFRKIEVRTTRQGLRVQARSGYAAPRDVPINVSARTAMLPPALTEILQSPLSISGLPLRIAAPVFRGTDAKASVAIIVEAGASQLMFTPNAARFDAALTLAIVAADMNGKTQAGERGDLRMRLSPQTHDAVLDRGARVVSTLDLKPGRYLLRIAALDEAQGTTRGSVQYDLDVPDFSKGPLTMSGIALASDFGAPIPTAGSDQLRWKQWLGAFPTTNREFAPQNELREYVEIYDNESGRPHTVELTTTLTDPVGKSVYRRQQTLKSQRDPGSKDKMITHRVVTSIPLNDLTRGRYVLTLEARSSLAVARPVSRQIPISVK